jgi:arsenite methyltransferase
MGIDLGELRQYVANMYSDVALLPRGEFHFPTGRPLLERLGYPPEVLDRVPAGALESFAGVGYHLDLDPLRPAERVLDIGSGAGTDVFCAALAVGPGGEVVGIDMTQSMLDKAERNRTAGGFSQVRFEKGYAESLPFPDAHFDAVISNGVINLTPDKVSTFSEIRRVLRPQGRLMFSDIVTGCPLPESVRENCTLWAECIGGAVEERICLALLAGAGLAVERTRPNERYAFTKDSTAKAAAKFQVHSISVLARRLT